jgi:hypothetical protein
MFDCVVVALIVINDDLFDVDIHDQLASTVLVWVFFMVNLARSLVNNVPSSFSRLMMIKMMKMKLMMKR